MVGFGKRIIDVPFSRTFPFFLFLGELNIWRFLRIHRSYCMHDGGDGSWVVNNVISQPNAGLMVDEDQERDGERSHTTETCGFLVFESAGSHS